MVRFFKRFGATALVAIIVFSLAAPCFATPAALTGIDFFTAAFQTFIEICGLTTVLSSNGVAADSSDPYSQVQLTDQYESLFDEYQTSISSSDTISDWYTTYSNSISVVPDQTTSVLSPTIDAQLSEWFSGFAGWILEDKYNCVRTDSGFTHSSGTFDSPLVSNSIMSIDGQSGALAVNGLVLGSGQYQSRVTLNGTVYPNTYLWSNSTFDRLYALSTTSYTLYLDQSNNSGASFNLSGNYIIISRPIELDGVSYYWADVSAKYYGQPTLQLLNVISGISSSSDLVSASEAISLRPKDKYNEDAIPVPNVESDTYVPEALEGEYSDAITGALTGVQNPTLDEILQAVLDVTLTNSEVIAEDSVDPVPPDLTPVEIPFLGFTLPSFNLGLSSIWQYVIDWVGSLGSGLSFIGSVWSNIPYAMVIPIYASAVVVIVLGMFKRFLL